MSTAPSTPQRPTSALTLSVLQNATTPVRNRVLLTPTRNKQKRCYDPLEDLKTLGVLLNLKQNAVAEVKAVDKVQEVVEMEADGEILDDSMDTIYKMSKQYKIDSFTTKNLSGFRLSGSSNVDSRDVSFDSNKRTRLSISSLPNTSNIAIPEAVLNDEDDNNEQEDNSSQNSFDLNELNEFQIDEIPDFNVPYDDHQEGDYSLIEQHDEFITKRRKPSINKILRTPKQEQHFSALMLKKLFTNLDSSVQWDSSSSETIDLLNEVTRTFIDKELLTLNAIREINGSYKSIGFNDVEFLMKQVNLFNDDDLLDDCSQSDLLDLGIKLFDLENVKDLENVLYNSRKRRKVNVELNRIDEESEYSEESDEHSDEDREQTDKLNESFEKNAANDLNDDQITSTLIYNNSNGHFADEKSNDVLDNNVINNKGTEELTVDENNEALEDATNNEDLIDSRSNNEMVDDHNHDGLFDLPQNQNSTTKKDSNNVLSKSAEANMLSSQASVNMLSDDAEGDLVDFANFNSEIALGIAVSEDESEEEDYSIPIADEEEDD